MLAVVDLLGPVAQTAGQVFFGLALVDPGGVLLLGAKQGVPFSQPEGVLCVLDAALGVGLIVLLGPAALEFIIFWFFFVLIRGVVVELVHARVPLNALLQLRLEMGQALARGVQLLL